MKKKLLVLCTILSLSSLAQAQELGVRFGEIVGGNVAIDGVFSSGQFSRIHADVSFGHGLGVEALWDVIYRPLAGAEGFYWYVGVGPYLYFDDPFQLGVSGELGIEYRFKDAPFVLGADWRPTLRIVENTDMLWDRAGFNIRYIFGSTTTTAK